jgi:methionine synthase II (cobalamin-independent)
MPARDQPPFRADHVGSLLRPQNPYVAERTEGMAICTHLCRGNYKSGWMVEGNYEHVAAALFSELRSTASSSNMTISALAASSPCGFCQRAIAFWTFCMFMG